MLLRKKKKGRSEYFYFIAVFQVPLSQYSQYARVAYFEVACSELLQGQVRTEILLFHFN